MTTSLALVLCCYLATALPAKADTGPDQDGWKFSGAAYLWAAGIEGTSAAGDDMDISFTDIVEDLDGGIMDIEAFDFVQTRLLGLSVGQLCLGLRDCLGEICHILFNSANFGIELA